MNLYLRRAKRTVILLLFLPFVALGVYPNPYNRYNSYNRQQLARTRLNSLKPIVRPVAPDTGLKSIPIPKPSRPRTSRPGGRGGKVIDKCDYYKAIGQLEEHPECLRLIEALMSTTTPKPPLPVCSANAALIQCTADPNNCPKSGQVCTQSDGSQCCQDVTAGVPVSHINAKPGSCPQPLGISALQDSTVGCWLDSNCPGIQKCCLEPNPAINTATRICRDPVGISSDSVCNLPLAVGSCTAPTIRYYYDASSGRCNSFQYSGCGGNANNFQSLSSCQATCTSSANPGIRGTPACPADANAGLNCLFAHADACSTDADCLGRENTVQPSCCMTKCGYRICYQY